MPNAEGIAERFVAFWAAVPQRGSTAARIAPPRPPRSLFSALTIASRAAALRLCATASSMSRHTVSAPASEAALAILRSLSPAGLAAGRATGGLRCAKRNFARAGTRGAGRVAGAGRAEEGLQGPLLLQLFAVRTDASEPGPRTRDVEERPAGHQLQDRGAAWAGARPPGLKGVRLGVLLAPCSWTAASKRVKV